MSNRLKQLTSPEQARRIRALQRKREESAVSKETTERIARVAKLWEDVTGCWVDEDYRPSDFIARQALALVVSVPDEAADKSGLFHGTLHGLTTDLLNETRFAFEVLIDSVIERDKRIAELQDRLARETRARREAERGRP